MLNRRTFCFSIAAQLTAQPPRWTSDVTTLLQKGVAEGKLPGAVALVEDDGETVFLRAVGWRDLKRRERMTSDTVFDMRSVTKPVTALAAMALVKDGKLALDEAVQKHLPEVAQLDTRKPITLRHLLTHTSGLGQSRPTELENLTERRDHTLAEVVSLYVRERLIAEPGSVWSYSSLGYALVGRLIEVVGGKPFDEFVEERVFQPFGMRDSFFHPPRRARERLASLHSWDKEQERLKEWSRTLPEKKWVYSSPDFGLYSTAADVSRLLRSMFFGRAGAGARPVAEQILEAHIEVDVPGLYQGLGWFVGKTNSLCEPLGIRTGCFGHNGAGGVMAWADPRHRRTVVFLQQVFFGPTDTGTGVVRLALCG